MTKHSVVVPESAITVPVPAAAAAAAAAGRHLYRPPRSGDCKTMAGHIDLSAVGAGRIGSWLESMKASSPRHNKQVAPAGEHDEWMEKHPSALAKFEAVMAAAKGKQIVMFLDYDGTLSPIVEDPDHAVMSEEMRNAVRAVAQHFPTAIVSGRGRDKVFNFVRLGELYYAGSHGMDIGGPTSESNHIKAQGDGVLFQAAKEFLPMVEEVYGALTAKVESIQGARVENNKFCLSVHFRCVEEKKWGAVAEQVKSVLKEYPKLRLTQGRKVLEVRPTIKWDKGKALEFLLKSLGYAECDNVFPMYIGDDRTDEDAFKVLRNKGQGTGILVTKIPKETSASYSLREPAEVMEFLHKLANSRS